MSRIPSGERDRRTRTTPTALGESILPVLSTTASAMTVSTFPTGTRIAEHGQRRLCVVRDLGGWCRQPRQLCLGFLRAFDPIVYSKFIQKYWWLRSPGTYDSVDYAWYVGSDGYLYNSYVYVFSNSYGRKIAGFIHAL